MTCRVVLIGYAGTGKTSVMDMLYKDYGLKKPTDYTTRAPRPGESYGNPYFFITEAAFKQLNESGKLFDHIEHAGKHYAADRDSLFVGAKWVMDIFPDSWNTFKQIPEVIGIYLKPPSHDVLRARMVNRGGASIEEVEHRLSLIKPQDEKQFDYTIEPQDTLEKLYEKIKAIVEKYLSK